MVHTRINDIKLVAHINELVESSTIRGRSLFKGRERGRVEQARGGAPFEKSPREKAPYAPHVDV